MAHTTGEHTPPTPNGPGPALQSAPPAAGGSEGRGCLYALSQPPLILFLTVIGTLLLIAGVHDQFLL